MIVKDSELHRWMEWVWSLFNFYLHILRVCEMFPRLHWRTSCYLHKGVHKMKTGKIIL